ncbi:hypothetical protein TWF696_004493 [Orbilia brochopaga]|uniref:Uncharacterized protein n=1 Tax=Orbilia brochopaga TaxID=3140254 RepID=A0AAV9V6E8_9PEZI
MSSRAPVVTSPPSSPSDATVNSDDDSDEELAAFLNPADKKSGLRASVAPPPKLSMAEILALTRKNKARDHEISRAKRLLDGDTTDKTIPSTVGDTSALPSEPKGDQETPFPDILKPSPLKPSQPDRQWSFFGSASDLSQSSYKKLREAWRETLAPSHLDMPADPHDIDDVIRDFLVSGSIANALNFGALQLVPDLYSLILDELCLESDEALSTAYLGVIVVNPRLLYIILLNPIGPNSLIARQSDRNHFDTYMDEARIKRLFALLGGSENALDLGSPLQMRPRGEETSSSSQNSSVSVTTSWWNVSLVLRLLAKIAQSLTPEQLRVSWGLVIRLGLDEHRMRERKCHVELLEVMEAFMYTFESGEYPLVESVLTDMKTTIVERPLQVQTLDLIPVTSTFSHKFRRRLALVFFSNNPVYLREALEPDILMRGIMDALDSRDVNPPKGETYSRVQNILDMINIAIDDAKWSARVVTTTNSGEPELLLDRLVLLLKHSKETIHEANDLNIEKSDAKDSFAKLILRLQCLRPRTKAAQTVIERYFRQDTEG